MERWNLGYDKLSVANPGLVMLRVTGFGQSGPYSRRAGFGTIAECMSGWAHCNGYPDGPPTLPPFGLADASAGLAGALGVMFALHSRSATGRGQVIDVALIEPLMTMLGAQPTIFDQLGIVQQRLGNRSPNSAPRNVYRTKDGRWVALAASAQTVAERVMRLIGHAETIEEPWFKIAGERAARADLLDRLVGEWIGSRDCSDVIREFEAAEAAITPIYDVSQVMSDPQYQALGSIVTVEDQDLGPLKMQNVMFRMLDTPGMVRFSGRHLGQDNTEVFGELGVGRSELEELRREGVV